MKQLWKKLWWISLAPLLAAPVCVRSAYPMGANAEQKLMDAHANGVLALGDVADWSALEPCKKCNGVNCFGVAVPLGDELLGHVETDNTNLYLCNFAVQRVLDDYLKKFVDPTASRATRRHFMVQLAPVFTLAKTTPEYLMGVPFNDSKMKTKYHALLDRVLPALAKHVQGNNDPVIALGLGNEVNYYLNTQPNPSTAWAQYKDFVIDAVGYVRAHWTNQTKLYTTVSTTFYGKNGPGDVAWGLAGNDPSLRDKAIDLMQQTDLLAFTYYPYMDHDSTDFAFVTQVDFNVIGNFADSTQRQAIIQEAGYPTVATPPYLAPLTTQTNFVNSLFAAAEAHSSQVLALDYFVTNDFQKWDFKTGFFDESGNNKSVATWKNFITKMAPNNCSLNGNVCCTKNCVNSSGDLQCGSTGCGSLPGHGAECCAGTIAQTTVRCDQGLTNAPCNLNCASNACCSTQCVNSAGQMQCGGSDCGSLPGGAAACCPNTIAAGTRHCDGDPSRAPCSRP